MGNGYIVQVRDLPPRPRDSHEIRNGEPDARPRALTVTSIGYADDCYPVRNETRQLRQPLEMTTTWLRDTGQVINASKSLSFEANNEDPTEVLLGGEVMPRKKNFKSLKSSPCSIYEGQHRQGSELQGVGTFSLGHQCDESSG